MMDALYQFATGSGFPLTVLAFGALVVVIEATKASRHALWGDLFSEDGDD